MAYAFWQMIAEISWWNYFLFSFIFIVALNARKPRIIPLYFLSITPFVFILLSCAALYSLVTFAHVTLFYWVMGCSAGLPLGWLQFRMLGIKGIKDKKAVYVPGTNTLFVITLLALLGDLYVRFHLNLSTSNLLTPENTRWLVMLYGAFCGLFLGRLSLAQWRIHKGPFVTLPGSTAPELSSH